MKIKATLIAATSLIIGSSSALAGGGKYVSYSPAPADYSKNTVVYSKAPVVYQKAKNPVPAPEPLCYGAGYEFSLFAAGIFLGEDSEFSDSMGGGVSLSYYFNENLGLDFSGAVYGTSSAFHNYTLDLVYRLPNQDACYAPYFFAGGGVHANSTTAGLGRLGAGFDYKIAPNRSVFVDGSYNWLASSVDDYVTVRAGLRFNF